MKTPADLSDKDAVIAAPLEQVETLVAENARLAARVAELEARLSLPPKTPDNSSLPPSKYTPTPRDAGSALAISREGRG